MRIRRLVAEVLMVSFVTLVTSAVVSVLWNVITRETTAIDWETSVRFAVVLGIIVPWIQTRRGKQS